MKAFIVAFMALAACPLGLAQDPGPSPTNSVGCEPHGDHWHCDGPATTPIATSSYHDEYNSGTETPTVPSPTESVGCAPHGDHWHCDGPRTSAPAFSTQPTAIPSSHHDEHEHATSTHAHDDHDDHEATGTPSVPSPTNSVGCEPHGDHWHCDGPRETSMVTTTPTEPASSGPPSSAPPSSTASTPAEFEGAAGSLRPVGISVLAVVAVAAYYV